MNEAGNPTRNPIQEQEIKGVDPNIIEQSKEDLRNLFKQAENPIAILLQTMDTDQFKGKIPDAIANPIRTRLGDLKFENEDEFVSKVLSVAMPILEITKKGQKDLYKQEGREMFTDADVRATVELIEKNKVEKIYVVGNVGSGKTTFARDLARATGYKNIDIDQWFQIFRQEQKREAEGLKELLGYIIQKEKPPFIINHADLLRQNLIQDADMVVFLNPKIEEQIKTRKIRAEKGAEGEWQEVDAGDYDKIAEQNITQLGNLGGKTEYSDEQSGTIIKVIKQ